MKGCSNRELLEFLERKASLGNLEQLLYQEKKESERLEKLKEEGKLDFGDVLSEGEMKALVPHAIKDVDGFLGVAEGKQPDIYYFRLFSKRAASISILGLYASSAFLLSRPVITDLPGNLEMLSTLAGTYGIVAASVFHAIHLNWNAYSPLSKGIEIKKETKPVVVPTISHEYSHSLQDGKLGRLKESALMEGHSRGVQRYASRLNAEREDNPAFLYNVTESTAKELESAYVWVCRKRGKSPNREITRPLSFPKNLMHAIFSGKPSHYDVGNAMCYLKEAEKGDGIYRKILDGTFTL